LSQPVYVHMEETVSSSVVSGKKGEDARTADLVEFLHEKGFRDAIAFPIHHRGMDKPDAQFSDGGLNIVSAKIGDERAAWRTANEYQIAFMSRGESLAEVFAVTYPSQKKDNYRLYILPSSTHREGIPVVFSSLEALVDGMVEAVKNRVESLRKVAIPPVDVARRMLDDAAVDLSGSLSEIEEVQLEGVFGGHDFFKNCLNLKLSDPKTRSLVLRQGPAHLFANQLLFYSLLSEAEFRTRGDFKKYPPIAEQDAGSPRDIDRIYFSRVRDKNYEPIYGIEVASLFVGKKASVACRDLVHAIAGLVPRLDRPDLIGQVFQTLIPPEIRKPLGAHFTNPGAARLLARLAISGPDASIMDPACGSGTLLVSGYERKRELLTTEKTLNPDKHRLFLEHQITGIDAIAIAGHLAAVNLASQNPLVETDHVRIAIMDSTKRLPGETVLPAEVSLPSEYDQVTLLDEAQFGRQSKPRSRVVPMSKSKSKPLKLDKVDVVLMNPPFTSWDHMQKSYREALNKGFSQRKPDYGAALFWKISQQAHFLLLADDFLKPGGVVGAVLPLTTFTGRAFQPLLEFLNRHYSIECIVYGLGRSSFSEQTSLSEVLFVAKKKAPAQDHEFMLVGTRTHPNEWDEAALSRIARACKGDEREDDLVVVGRFRQEELLPDHTTLPGLMLMGTPSGSRAMKVVRSLRQNPNVVHVKELGAEIHRWVLGSEHIGSKPESDFYGSKALFACRQEERALKDIDRLVFNSESSGRITLKDRVYGTEFTLGKNEVQPALRRFTGLDNFDITNKYDFVVNSRGESLRSILGAFYAEKDVKRFLANINKRSKKFIGGRWAFRVKQGSTRVAFAGRLDLAASGTTVIAARAEVPFFLAAYGYMIQGLDTRSEKLVTLWMNSSLAIFDILCRLTLTRGSWARIESYVVDDIPIPNPIALSESQWQRIERLYDKLKKLAWPSLVNQLGGDVLQAKVFGGRSKLDEELLDIVGVREPAKAAELLERAVSERILELKSSMAKKKSD